MNKSVITIPSITAMTILSFTLYMIQKMKSQSKQSHEEKNKIRNKIKNNNHNNNDDDNNDGYESLIGNTPLIKLEKLSSHLVDHKSIYVKMECLNPGGTGKDRAALSMIQEAERAALLPPAVSTTTTTTTATVSDSDSNNHMMTTIQKDNNHYTNSQKSHNNQNIDMNSNNSNHNNCNKPLHPTETSTDIDFIIHQAISRTRTGGIVVEGTSGSTGISLATLSTRRGHSIIIVMPDDQAQEKRTILQCIGALVHVVPNVAISNPNHYVNVARRIAHDINTQSYASPNPPSSKKHDNNIIMALFTNQFENESNFKIHYETTGPELWQQTHSRMDAFCMSSGTGGTLAGVAAYLHDCVNNNNNNNNYNNNNNNNNNKVKVPKVILVDPPGSALYNKIKYGVAYTTQQSERSLFKHRYDTLVEGVGLDRITRNFALGVDKGFIHDAVRITDQETVDMAHWLLRQEGLFVGSSSAMNVAGALKVAQDMPSNSIVVTVICDGGQRHLTRFWNKDFITGWGLLWPGDDELSWKERLPNCLSN